MLRVIHAFGLLFDFCFESIKLDNAYEGRFRSRYISPNVFNIWDSNFLSSTGSHRLKISLAYLIALSGDVLFMICSESLTSEGSVIPKLCSSKTPEASIYIFISVGLNIRVRFILSEGHVSSCGVILL